MGLICLRMLFLISFVCHMLIWFSNFSSRIMEWKRITWRIWSWGWELRPIAYTWLQLIGERAQRMKEVCLASRPMTSSPLWWSWSVQQRACSLGSTGDDTFSPPFVSSHVGRTAGSCSLPHQLWNEKNQTSKLTYFMFDFSIFIHCRI